MVLQLQETTPHEDPPLPMPQFHANLPPLLRATLNAPQVMPPSTIPSQPLPISHVGTGRPLSQNATELVMSNCAILARSSPTPFQPPTRRGFLLKKRFELLGTPPKVSAPLDCSQGDRIPYGNVSVNKRARASPSSGFSRHTLLSPPRTIRAPLQTITNHAMPTNEEFSAPLNVPHSPKKLPVRVPAFVVNGEGEDDWHEAQGEWMLGTTLSSHVDVNSSQSLHVVYFEEG